jgi:branched-chain amino acid aminotransferase
MSDEGFAWVNGRVLPRGEAAIPVDDFAFRFGAAAFETMLALNGRVFRLDSHLDRLEGAVRLMYGTPPSRKLLANAIKEALRANDLGGTGARASVRLSVSAGVGHAPDLRLAQDPTIVVTVDALGDAAPRTRLAIARVRIDHRRAWRASKMAQFLPYLLAREEAREQGADDALLLNTDGHVAEVATSNIFFVIGGRLVTPSLDSGPLPGVTRSVIIELACDLGEPVVEAEVTLEQVVVAEAAFATNSVSGVFGLTELTGVPPASPQAINLTFDPQHPLIRRVGTAYEATVVRECGAAG